MLRKLKSRTMEDLWKNLGELCDIFTPKECYHYYKNAGYGKIKKFHSNVKHDLVNTHRFCEVEVYRNQEIEHQQANKQSR